MKSNNQKQEEDNNNDEEFSLRAFIEDTIDKMNLRFYGNIAIQPSMDAFTYLEKEEYSDDDDNEEEEVVENSISNNVTTSANINSSSIGASSSADDTITNNKDEVGDGDNIIELSDSEDEDDVRTNGNMNKHVVNLARMKVEEAAAQEAAILEERRRRYEEAVTQKRLLGGNQHRPNSRAALLLSLRQKVHQTAKENYCNQRRIQTEQLALRLQITEKCR